MKEKYTYVLRTCYSDMTAFNRFKWPKRGPVEAPDWKPFRQCGNGLHGFLMGEGDGSLANWGELAKWLVVKVKEADIVDLGDKVKFPKGYVVFTGSRKEATDYIIARGAKGAVVGAELTVGYKMYSVVGDYGTATAGNRGTATAGCDGTATAGDDGTATTGRDGTATAGNDGTATAGDRGTATAGDRGTATAGDDGTATAGYDGTATVGYCGTATAGDEGTATAGDYGTATAGDYGTATAGYSGTATAGDGGIATAGNGGTATAGQNGVIQIKYFDGQRYRIVIGYIGEKGLKPDTPYQHNGEKFVEA